MGIEQSIAEMLQAKLSDGTMEKIIEEKLAKCVSDCMDNMFRWSGPAKELIESKLKEVMVPVIEKHDFNDYALKLDAVLTEIVNSTSLEDNKRILENFKGLMKEDEEKEINLSSIYEKWTEYVAKNVSTDDLDVIYEDGVSYETVSVEMDVEDIENVSKYGPEKKIVRFTCDHDEEMNLQFELYKYDFMKQYEVSKYGVATLNGLYNLDEMQILLMRLGRQSTKIIIDQDNMQDDIRPEEEPEPTYE